ncbi:MAG: CRTAC1 family protein [bacterium]|nr:CRTAC1 family protein [bacterium]
MIVGEIQGSAYGSPTVFLNEGYQKKKGHYKLASDPLTTCVEGLTLNSLNWIDYNHDNLPDLLVTEFHPDKGAKILQNTGNGFGLALDLPEERGWAGAVVADYDQNGQDDLVLLPKNGHPALFMGKYESINSYSEQAYPLGLRDGATSGGFAADFNNDNDPDLYFGRENTDDFLYRNVRVDGTDDPSLSNQNWIRFNLETLGNCNASLIGTQVIVQAGGKQWLQTVDGGSGRGGQSSNELHFGLGNVTGPANVTVNWPTSSAATFTGLSINSTHDLIDDAIPTFHSGAERFSHEPFPEGADWVFAWNTAERGSEELDEVDLDFGSYSPGEYCYVMPNITLHYGDPDVEISIYPLASGGWGHKLVWQNQSCLGEQICDFQFRARSSVGAQPPIEGPWVDFGEFDVCITKKGFSN